MVSPCGLRGIPSHDRRRVRKRERAEYRKTSEDPGRTVKNRFVKKARANRLKSLLVDIASIFINAAPYFTVLGNFSIHLFNQAGPRVVPMPYHLEISSHNESDEVSGDIVY